MEAKDLMIDDWVQVPSELNRYKRIRSTFDMDRAVLYKPIPLTPEILEKNEFECKHKGEALRRLYWILNVGGGSVKVKINRGLFLIDIFGVPFQHGFYRPFVHKHIQYVHELQHALRLCGITKEIEL